MKARNRNIHKIKPSEQHPYQSGLTNISSLVQKLPISKEVEDLVHEINELAKVQTISVFEIGKRLVIARSEMHDKKEWGAFLEAVSMSASLASRYIKAYETLHPLEASLTSLPASKIFELMYLDNVDEVVEQGLYINGERRQVEELTVKQIRDLRKGNTHTPLKVKPFQQEKKSSSILSARIPSDLSEQFQQYAHAHNRSVSELLAEMIERTVSDNIIEATDEQGEQS
ncbi:MULTISPECIES: DUF3102 domain-containing protein [unclassified Exiguobacterium]|uniref:DUF3102 domain-containing protein n=1 Tax=unclassified Exiguobacterium TaxID=2644629 RepID=UPI001BEA8E8B|nr:MULTISPECIES: DUF3102 domain-containing protein [unclassified Exiguobacterium]